MNGEPIPMPANQSTPEVTRAGEARRLIEKLAAADIDVSGTAAIGITSADIIAANDWLSATPARGGDELREAAQAMLSKRWASSSGEWGIPEWVETDEPRRFAEQVLASTDMAGAGEEVDYAEAARVMFDACRDRFMRAEQCYPAIDALASAGFITAPPVEGLTSGEGIARAAAAMREEWLRRASDHPGDFFEAMAQVALAASPKATATASVREDRFANDAAAKALYDTWTDQPGWVPWVDRGNSDAQERARREVML